MCCVLSEEEERGNRQEARAYDATLTAPEAGGPVFSHNATPNVLPSGSAAPTYAKPRERPYADTERLRRVLMVGGTAVSAADAPRRPSLRPPGHSDAARRDRPPIGLK